MTIGSDFDYKIPKLDYKVTYFEFRPALKSTPKAREHLCSALGGQLKGRLALVLMGNSAECSAREQNANFDRPCWPKCRPFNLSWVNPNPPWV